MIFQETLQESKNTCCKKQIVHTFPWSTLTDHRNDGIKTWQWEPLACGSWFHLSFEHFMTSWGKLKVLVFIIKEEDSGSKIITLNMGMSIITIAILCSNNSHFLTLLVLWVVMWKLNSWFFSVPRVFCFNFNFSVIYCTDRRNEANQMFMPFLPSKL